MQALTDDLKRILRGRLQAGADGFHSRIILDPLAQITTDSSWRTLPLSWWNVDETEVINAEPTGWKLAGFDDAAWAAADEVTQGWWPTIPAGPFWLCDLTIVSRPALISAIYLARVEFSLARLPADPVSLQYGADNGVEMFLN